MATKIFESKDRNEAHAELEKRIVSGYPAAECREAIENGNGPTLYQVWDGSDEKTDVAKRPGVDPTMVIKTDLSQSDLEKLADLLAARLRA